MLTERRDQSPDNVVLGVEASAIFTARFRRPRSCSSSSIRERTNRFLQHHGRSSGGGSGSGGGGDGGDDDDCGGGVVGEGPSSCSPPSPPFHSHLHPRRPLQHNNKSLSVASFPDYVAKFRSKMVEIRSSFRRTARIGGLYGDYWMPPGNYSTSSSTPTVPLSGSELLYGEGSRGQPHHNHTHGSSSGAGGSEEAGGDGSWEGQRSGGGGGGGGGDRQQQQALKLKELDLHGNKRPSSRSNGGGSGGNNGRSSSRVAGFDKVPFDREREELRPLGGGGSGLVGPGKQPVLRANGLKNHLLRADHFLPPRASNGRGDDDLVAMGTIWNPSQLQQGQGQGTRGSAGTTTTTASSSSGKSTSGPNTNNAGGGGGGEGGRGGLPGRRPVNLSTNMSTRQLMNNSSTGKVVKEVEPKYNDPLSGASPTFQQRLMELAGLEAETVRWERTKKIKKKPKQDRDS